ncbi:hypothetical protein Taro_037977 [Colocasia esculenta]|uniref:DDE Tnp4 domain-containing protein n=1 Tax=Colocasia esculenta TaxID=4460 RepID=A0A843WRB3_COLES|nr:hypothetical protein [Colocasia esculenta]
MEITIERSVETSPYHVHVSKELAIFNVDLKVSLAPQLTDLSAALITALVVVLVDWATALLAEVLSLAHPHSKKHRINDMSAVVDMLVSKSLLKDSRHVSANEQLAMFLYTVGHGVPTGALVEHFQHSSQTISHYVNKPTQVNECHPHISGNDRFYPYFKDALGAIDGTHIPVNVAIDGQPRFRNQKQGITQNVMAVVSFDGLFQYACVGWEGSAPDMKVLRWAISRGEFVVPLGKYFLVDGGCTNTSSFLIPYRGHRYHISSFRRLGNGRYDNKQEKFNHRHAQLRNCVERALGVLKMRFQTLREGNMYPFDTQKKIVFACLVVHNYIRREQGYDDFFNAPFDDNESDEGLYLRMHPLACALMQQQG